MSMAKSWCLENCRCQKMHQRSHKKYHLCNKDLRSETTEISSLCLSLTSILAFSPLLLSASINRWVATAAPPVFSLVLTNNIFISYHFISNDRKSNIACPLSTTAKIATFTHNTNKEQRLSIESTSERADKWASKLQTSKTFGEAFYFSSLEKE